MNLGVLFLKLKVVRKTYAFVRGFEFIEQLVDLVLELSVAFPKNFRLFLLLLVGVF